MSIKNIAQTDRRFFTRDIPSDEILNLVKVPLHRAEYMRVLDVSGTLALIHYLVPIRENGEEDESILNDIAHVRGTIVDTSAMRIVCGGFGHTPELPLTIRGIADGVAETSECKTWNPAVIDRIFDAQETYPGQLQVYHAAEGTLVRLFYFCGAKDKSASDGVAKGWHLATHRKINATKSYWVGDTFGEIFSELIDIQSQSSLLDEKCSYSFLLVHPGTRLIYPVRKASITLAGVYNCESGESSMYSSAWPQLRARDGTLIATQASKTMTVPVASTPENIMEAIQIELQRTEALCEPEFAGALVYTHPCAAPFKIVTAKYAQLRAIRGNDPCLRARDIHLFGTADGAILEKWFNELEYQEIYARVRNEISELASYLCRLYMRRYVKKDSTELPKEEFVTLKRAHTWHCENRAKNYVTDAKIHELLTTTPQYFLLQMLNRRRDAAFAAANAAAAAEEAEEKAAVVNVDKLTGRNDDEVVNFAQISVKHPPAKREQRNTFKNNKPRYLKSQPQN